MFASSSSLPQPHTLSPLPRFREAGVSRGFRCPDSWCSSSCPSVTVWVAVLVSLGCYNKKPPQTGRLRQQVFVSQFRRLGSPGFSACRLSVW